MVTAAKPSGRGSNKSKRPSAPPPVKFQGIEYISSQEFPQLTADQIDAECPRQLYQADPDIEATSLHAARTARLLTPAGERHLFRKMNFLKFTAERLRQRVPSRLSGRARTAQTEQLLASASQVRAMLVEANLRLVAALARKFASVWLDEEELISEGHLILVKSIDKFDYSRGFRFSTYATNAIQRHYFRMIKRQQRRRTREVTTSSDLLAQSLPQPAKAEMLDPRVADELVRHFDRCLDERERLIIRGRFGLSGSQESATLNSLAGQFGLSKERVRQLQLQAIRKLQDLAQRLNLQLETCA